MGLYTEDYLRQRAQRFKYDLNETTERALKELSKFDYSKQYDIFLSHSIKDKEVILGLAQELKELGFTVYVDWVNDPQLDRSNVNKFTAELLQLRMKSCNSLLFAYSNNSPSSKWMPWELGYFDGIKNRVAVLQIVPTDDQGKKFPGQEYLELYPYIDHLTLIWDNSLREIWVNDRSGKQVSYKRWLITGKFS